MNTLPKAYCSLFGIKEDFTARELSLDEHFVKRKNSTFFFQASGDSMAPLIMNHDILIVDRSLKLKSGHIFVVNFEGQLLCKRVLVRSGRVVLASENERYKEIIVTNPDEFSSFGAVIGLARHLHVQ